MEQQNEELEKLKSELKEAEIWRDDKPYLPKRQLLVDAIQAKIDRIANDAKTN